MARFFYLLILLVLVAAVGVFAYQNSGPVSVQFLNWGTPTTLAVVVGAAYVLGMFSGWSVVGMFRRTLNRVTEDPRYRQ